MESEQRCVGCKLTRKRLMRKATISSLKTRTGLDSLSAPKTYASSWRPLHIQSTSYLWLRATLKRLARRFWGVEYGMWCVCNLIAMCSMLLRSNSPRPSISASLKVEKYAMLLKWLNKHASLQREEVKVISLKCWKLISLAINSTLWNKE